MRTLKSFWFWFLVIWILVGIVTALVFALKFPPWTWIHTASTVVWFSVGILTGLILRQRSLIKNLSKGAESKASDAFVETWKTGFSADTIKLMDSLESTPGSGPGAKRLIWVLSPDVDQAKAILEGAGALDATETRDHELSGEFKLLGSWFSRKDEVYLLLRDLPDPRVPATQARTKFFLEQLTQRGKLRPVDGVVVLAGLQKGGVPSNIHAALSYLAETSGVEFPIYLGLHGAESLVGGNEFYALCPEPPGATIPWTKQEDLPAAFDKAWLQLESNIEAKESGHLAVAWEKGSQPNLIFQHLDALRGQKDAVRSAVFSCASQFVGRTLPFFRGFYLLPKPQAAAPAKADSPAPILPPTPAFGSGVFDGGAFESGSSAATSESATSSVAGSPLLESFLELIHAEPVLARLGAHRQIKAGTLSLALFVGALLLSFFTLWAAMHGWVTGSKLERGWKTRLSVDRSAEWTDVHTMQANLDKWDDADRLVDDIKHGRPWLLAPGFYRSKGTLPEAQVLWDTLTRRIVRAAFVAQEARLKTLAQSRDTMDTKDLYGSLKVYLLTSRLGWAEGRDKEGKKGLAEALVHSWSDLLGYTGALPPFERSVLPRIAAEVAERIDDEDSSWLGPQDGNLVFNARLQLKNTKNQSGTYARIIATADTLPKLDWDSLGFSPKEITCHPLEIPGAYTRRGWLESVQPTIKAMSEGGKDWVMGKAADNEEVASVSEVVTEVKRRYVEDFVKAWNQALDSSTCLLPGEAQQIGATLSMLASPYNKQNPKGIGAFFQRILDETDLRPPKDTGRSVLPGSMTKAANNAAQVVGAVNRFMGADEPVDVQVPKRLASIRGLATDWSKGRLDTYTKDLGQLGSVFSQWNGEAAVQFAKGITAQNIQNPLVHAWNEANGQKEKIPSDIRAWYGSFTLGLLRQIAARALPQAQAQATQSYREKVLQPWQNLSRGSYPFDPYAENEANINDIDALLNPKSGSLATFFHELEGLVQVQNGQIKALSANGLGISLDPQAVDQLQKLMKIATFFYGPGGSTWRGVNATIKVRADSRAKVTLRVGSQSLEVPQGQERSLAVRWPQPNQAGVSLGVATIHQSFEERREGEWALLRLMESRGPGTSEASWSFNDLSYIVDVPVSVRLDAAGGPFTDRDFFHVSLLSDPFR